MSVIPDTFYCISSKCTKDNCRTWHQGILFSKSGKTNKLGRGLLIAGGGLILIGAVIPKGDLKEDWILWQEYENVGIKAAFILTGVISLVGSIPSKGQESHGYIQQSKHLSRRAWKSNFQSTSINLSIAFITPH